MQHLFRSRFWLIAGLLLATFSFAAAPALADVSGPYNWTDITNQLDATANRPVWASAYASPYWYLTDGQTLSTGGHVWRSDGTYVADITTSVESAGISRVDDIVSDGQTVLFLQNVVALNNQFTVVAWNGSTGYTNDTYALRTQLSGNEGIASITGANGNWMIVTTTGRVLSWNFSTNSGALYTQSASQWMNDGIYSVRHVSPADGRSYLPTVAVPVSSGFLVGTRNANGNMSFVTRSTYGSVSDITGQFGGISTVYFVASNGSQALVIGRNASNSQLIGVETNGASTQILTLSTDALVFDWTHAISAWDGTGFAIMADKEVLQYTPSTNGFTRLADTNDLFLTGAGDGNGTMLFGGAVSAAGDYQPTNPLTAKLVSIQRIGYVNTGGNTNVNTNNGSTYTSTNGPTITTTGSPSSWSINDNQSFNYQVSATDPNGVSRIDIYVNNSRVDTCYSTSCNYTTTYTSDGDNSRVINFYAVAQDSYGYSTQSQVQSLTVWNNNDNNGYNTNNSTSNGISVSSWLSPNESSISQGQSVTYQVQASASQSLQRIDIYANGSVIQTCNGGSSSLSCSTSIYGSSYTLNTTVALNAKVTDVFGNVAWSNLTNLGIYGTSSNNNNGANGIYATSYLSPNESSLPQNQSVSFYASANASQSLSRIDLYANGNIIQSCTNGSTSMSCSTTLTGYNYAVGSQVSLNAKVTDIYGNTQWTSLSYLTITSSNGSTNGNGSNNSSISVTSYTSPSVSSLQQNQSISFIASANASQGVSRLDIYANGGIIQTCTGSYQTLTCSATLNGSGYSVGSQVALNAKATDIYGNVNWSSLTYLTVTSNNGSSNNGNTSGNASNVTASSWVTPAVSSLGTNQSVQFQANATAPQGIQRIDLYVNGTVLQSCSGGGTCSTTIWGSNYPVGTQIAMNAKVTDDYGNVAWTSLTYLTVTSSNGSTNGGTTSGGTSNGTVSVSTDHPGGTYHAGDTIVITATGNDPAGVSHLDIFANGAQIQSCNASTCSASVIESATSLQVSATLWNDNYQSVTSNTQTLYLR